jgi:hypothetical protein
MQLFAIADGDLHRVAAAGAEIAVKELGVIQYSTAWISGCCRW